MKRIINISFSLLALLFFMGACSSDNIDGLSESGLPKVSEMSFTITVDSLNVVTFHLNNSGCVPIWIFGDEDIQTGQDYQRTYNNAGTYTVEAKVYNRNGVSEGSVEETFEVENSIALKYLSGGSSKTWIWDYTVDGHFGCGSSGSTGLNWWSASANGQASTGMYDDELTFTSDYEYTFDPGPDSVVYVNYGSGYKPEYLVTAGSDYKAPCDILNTTFSIEAEGENTYLVFPENTMLSYIPNAEALTTPKYQIISINDNLLELVIDNGSIAWHYQFVPKE